MCPGLNHKATEDQSDMMITKVIESERGRDTMMCGDPKAWFPMRVTYQREMKVKAELDRLGIENFVPMTYRVVDADTDNPRRELVPAISNLIFVRSTQERLSELKQSNEVLEPLRYMMDHTTSCEHVPSPSSPPYSSRSSLLTNLTLGPDPRTKFFANFFPNNCGIKKNMYLCKR